MIKMNNMLAEIWDIHYILTSKIICQEYDMSIFATTKLSSKGQVVIPEEIRDQLGLKAGSQFIVLGDKDVVILKSITPPKIEEFSDLVGKVRKQAKKAGIKKSDIEDAIKKVRSGS